MIQLTFHHVGNGWEMGGKWGQITVFVITQKRGLSPFFEVINGSDRKELIASYAVKFESILRATSSAPETK